MKKALLTLLLLTQALLAETVEVGHIHEINDFLTKECLLILDIDDTLLVPVQMLGCDEWFQTRLKKHQSEGMNKEDALEKSLAEWESIRHVTQMKVVEPGTESVVHRLQEQGYCAIGLTTQGLALATRTKQQLNANKIDLSRTSLFKKDHYIYLNGHGVLYRDGILFTSGTSKGEALFRLLDENGYTPSRIVFLNDKASHLADLEHVAKQRGCTFIGLRYAFADKHKKAFDPEIADFQFKASSFAHLLSDEEAEAMLKKKTEMLIP